MFNIVSNYPQITLERDVQWLHSISIVAARECTWQQQHHNGKVLHTDLLQTPFAFSALMLLVGRQEGHPAWCHCHSMSPASVKSKLVLPFWYWLTRVIPDKGLLNVCLCMCVCYYGRIKTFEKSPHRAVVESSPLFCVLLESLANVSERWYTFQTTELIPRLVR